MRKDIDALIIGHNEMNFEDYENTISNMGTSSEEYRDLNMNFIQYNNKPHTLSDMYNAFVKNDEHEELNLGNTFTATIAYLASFLKKKGYEVDFINSFQSEKDVLIDKLQKHNIKTIVITTTLYVSIFPILEIMEIIKSYNEEAKIILGGHFISNCVRNQDEITLSYIFETIGADFYVNSSQGELALSQIIYALKNSLPFDEINNIYYLEDGEYIGTKVLAENNILKDNMVDWSLFEERVGRHAAIRTAISCPFRCKFCGFPQHAGEYQMAGVEDVERELDSLRGSKIESIHFIDDTFNVPADRFKAILRMMIKNKYKFKWHSYFRCQFADRETIELMKESGCEGVFLGIESGNQQILKNMNKSSTIEKYKEGIKLLKEYGIITFASFIVGFPGETYESFKDTVKFIEETKPDFYRAQLWYCEPITPIYKEKELYGLDGEQFRWSHNTMTSREAVSYIEEMFLEIKNSIWLPQHNFDFIGLFYLLHRGMDIGRIENFVRTFNKGIKQKLINTEDREIDTSIVRELMGY